MMTRSPEEIHPCPSCQIGHLRAKRVLFFDHGSVYPVVAPQFPGWVCDVCGYRAYDPEALIQLQALLWTSHTNHHTLEPRTTHRENEPRRKSTDQRRRP
jgi:YgiT-type zinc finger domain-containing protein